MYTILVADDEPIMLSLVEKILHREGYHVLKTSSAHEVVEIINNQVPDLLLTDVNLPDRNGLSLCRDLRANQNLNQMPIIFLTGSAAGPDDIAEALNAGGDDFIRKPFAARELAARVRAQLRRVQLHREQNVASLRLDAENYRVQIDGRTVDLTRVEFNLLRYMCEQPNTWITTRDLLANVWRYPGSVGDAALVRNHVRNLRRKIEVDADHPQIILSRHRRGYLVAAQIETDSAESVGTS
jgi:DNA-binding response OmpR family regulator